jgi:hypothetical protein
MSASIIAEVERTAAEVAAVTAALASAQLHRDDAVRQGHTVAELMAPAGLSRERLYQIRDRRRGPRIN